MLMGNLPSVSQIEHIPSMYLNSFDHFWREQHISDYSSLNLDQVTLVQICAKYSVGPTAINVTVGLQNTYNRVFDLINNNKRRMNRERVNTQISVELSGEKENNPSFFLSLLVIDCKNM